MNTLELPASILAELTDEDINDEAYVVIHHTDDTDELQDAASINQEEIASGGYTAIPYNFVVDKNGRIQVGRPISKKNAANLGLNSVSVSIVFDGAFQPGTNNYTGETPSPAAIAAAISIVNKWLKPKLKNLKYLCGHRDVWKIAGDPGDATACPGDTLYSHLHDMRLATGLQEPPQVAQVA